MTGYRPLPIGIEDFKELVMKNYYFVDKTLMIKELIDIKSKVTLFTRPRRFGKTLNMSMLRRYFEKSPEDNAVLFDGLDILYAGEEYRKYMGKYPVISISLKSMKQPSYEKAFWQFKDIIIDEFCRHDYVLKSDKLKPVQKKRFEDIYNDTADDSAYDSALKLLSDCVSQCCEENVVILIDEYDVPLENAYFCGFYDEMVGLVRSVFEKALKTNSSLEFSVLTGCLCISKESIFTGFNNMNIFSVNDVKFSEYSGFTENEVVKFLKAYGLEEKFEEIKRWYDGYIFGETEIYNPWSVLKYIQSVYFNRKALPEPYWSNTSSNSIIHELVAMSGNDVKKSVELIVNGGSVDKPLYESITYSDIQVNAECIWSFLLHTGYLKPIKKYKSGNKTYFTGVIPNIEVLIIYEDTIRHWFDEKIKASDKSKLLQAVLENDAETFELEVNRWLLRSISYHDGYENFYHGFLTGLLEYSDEYLVISNRESGTGRSDIIIKNVLTRDKAIIIEVKSSDNERALETSCDTALRQINEKHYDTELIADGYKNILKYGIAFCQKRCHVKSATD